jgi:hypothetical protein
MRSSMTRPHIITGHHVARIVVAHSDTRPAFFLDPGEQQKRYPPPVASCLRKPLIDIGISSSIAAPISASVPVMKISSVMAHSPVCSPVRTASPA